MSSINNYKQIEYLMTNIQIMNIDKVDFVDKKVVD
jgi:hypothetical protein